jgi:acyl-CoA synthetase (AMP-forming)/AMP-acid ligase II
MTAEHLSGHLAERICAWGIKSPDKVAIDDYGDVWTYRRLAGDIDCWAGRLQQSGLRAGDTVLLFLPQTAEAIAAYFGVMRCGAVPSFMPLPSPKQVPSHYWHSHANLLRLIQPSAILTLDATLAAMRSVGFADLVPILLAADGDWTKDTPWTGASPGAADDIALLQHSSGTTMLKKGVQLSHGAIARQVASYARALQASPDEVVVSWLPMYHDMGLIACTVMPLLLGQTVVLLDPFKWVSEPVSLLTAIHRHRGTLTWLPNFAFELLAKTVRFEPGSFDLSSMRAFINCSEPCKAATFDRFLAKFAPIGVRAEALQVCYAMAETVFAVSQTDIGRQVLRLRVDAHLLSEEKLVAAPRDSSANLELLSAGSALDGMHVTIVDAHGQELPADHVGEIELSSEFLFDGYLNRPEITAEKLRAGRYRTNDMGFVHGDQVFILGRADDLLIVHGRNYFAHEVEAVVNDVAGLKAGRNVAVAVFNEMLGSQDVVVIAELALNVLVQADKGLELKRAVKQAVAERMGLELRDVRIVQAGWLAKTTSGKISRSLNRDKYLIELAAARQGINKK